MNKDELKNLGYTEHPDGIWRRAGYALDRLPNSKPQQNPGQTLDAQNKGKRPRRPRHPRFHVTLVSYRPGTLDLDNLTGGAKHLRDAIADELLPGEHDADSEKNITWEYHQIKSNITGTAIIIHPLI